MTIKLIDSVHEIFNQVHLATGKPVELIENQDMSVYAMVKIARNSMQSHILYYKPEHGEILNHLIAHECGHILRMFSVSAEKRFVPFTDNDIKRKALTAIDPELNKLSQTIQLQHLAHIVNLWYSGLIRQLTNCPSDIRIEKWIYDSFTDLRPYQEQSISKQYEEAVVGLSERVEKLSPRTILIASNSMNYVFFSVLGDYFKDDRRIRRYKRSDCADTGKKLLSIQKESVDDYSGDMNTVDKWADILGISGWFAWRAFEDMPESYLNVIH
jgi:hypothetical protein